MTIPDEAVEEVAARLYDLSEMQYTHSFEMVREGMMEDARELIQSILPHIQAQTLDEAVDAFPLETIHAPDNAVVWMHRRAEEIRARQ